MARLARIVIPGLAHHVMQRGNRRQTVFFSDQDRMAYLDEIRKGCERYKVAIWAWCLMSNHVHFIAVPETEQGLARCFGVAHVRYTRRINFREKWRGFLWQGRFGASVLDWPHVYHAVRYVERNPVRAGLVRVAWTYEWSSAGFHAGIRADDPLCRRTEELERKIADWRKYLAAPEEEEAVALLRRESAVGRPVAGEKFIRKLENQMNVPLRRHPRGRPKGSRSYRKTF